MHVCCVCVYLQVHMHLCGGQRTAFGGCFSFHHRAGLRDLTQSLVSKYLTH